MLSDVVVVVAVLRQYVQQHTKAMAATRPTNRIMTNLISLFWGSIWFSLSPFSLGSGSPTRRPVVAQAICPSNHHRQPTYALVRPFSCFRNTRSSDNLFIIFPFFLTRAIICHRTTITHRSFVRSLVRWLVASRIFCAER